MKRFHLIFGITVVVIFLLTGQYMDRYLSHLEGMADGPRLLYRTRHIFILLAGLLNLGLGAYFSFRATQAARVMQTIGSTLIVLATILFIIAFIYEPKMNALETPFSHRAMYSILAGTLLHVLSGIRERSSR
jgi:magnesium-transporting ATPase (P-type)